MKLKNSPQVILALITTFGFFYCIFHMLKMDYPAQNKDQLNALIGVLTTIFTLQMNYFYGSTSGSKAKDDTIAEVAKMPSGNIEQNNVKSESNIIEEKKS